MRQKYFLKIKAKYYKIKFNKNKINKKHIAKICQDIN